MKESCWEAKFGFVGNVITFPNNFPLKKLYYLIAQNSSEFNEKNLIFLIKVIFLEEIM